MPSIGFTTWLLWFVCLGVAILLLKRDPKKTGSLEWLNPRLYFGIAFIFMDVFVPFNIFVTGQSYRGIILTREANLMLASSILSGVAFLIGWRVTRIEQTKIVRRYDQTSSGLFFLRAFMLVPIMIWVVYTYLTKGTQPDWMVAYIFALASFIVGCVLMVLAATAAKSALPRYIYAASAIGLSVLYVWLATHQGSRLMFLLLILPVMGIGLFKFRHAGSVLTTIVGLAFLLFFVFYGKARLSILNDSYVDSSELRSYVPKNIGELYERLFLHGDLDAFENGALVMKLIPDAADFYYGATFATVFLSPIPRAWWPEKPAASVNYLLTDYYGFSNDNFAVSLQAEAYANFYWPGVILLFVAFGYLSKRIFAVVVSCREDPEKWALLGLYSAYVMLVMRGSFHSMTSYYLMVLFWLLGSRSVIKLLTKGSKRHAYLSATEDVLRSRNPGSFRRP